MDASIAILIGAGLATTGWVYTARRARSLARKQHTITVMLQAGLNERFLSARATIAPHLKQGACPEDMLKGENEELRDKFRLILNHYEFVAAGLRNGDFDERLVRDSERGTFIALFKCCEPYIYALRDHRTRMAIYEHLEWLYERWETSPPNKAQRAIERVRGSPLYGRRNHNGR